jgi:RHS repeat-associated protein
MADSGQWTSYLANPQETDDFLARVDGNGVTWLLTDHQGSVTVALSPDGSQVVAQATYDAFGNVTLVTGTAAELGRLGFQGGMTDEVTGLVHFGARDYDPTTGRWRTPDPANADSNTYRGMGNSPTNGTDPTGMFNENRAWQILETMNKGIYEWFRVRNQGQLWSMSPGDRRFGAGDSGALWDNNTPLVWAREDWSEEQAARAVMLWAICQPQVYPYMEIEALVAGVPPEMRATVRKRLQEQVEMEQRRAARPSMSALTNADLERQGRWDAARAMAIRDENGRAFVQTSLYQASLGSYDLNGDLVERRRLRYAAEDAERRIAMGAQQRLFGDFLQLMMLEVTLVPELALMARGLEAGVAARVASNTQMGRAIGPVERGTPFAGHMPPNLRPIAPGKAGPFAETMERVPGTKLAGEKFTDFIIGGGEGEGFIARLEGDVLDIGWHGGTGNLKPRLSQVNALAEGKINTVKGYATDNLLEIVEGRAPGQSFDPARWSRGMEEAFGGKWTTKLEKVGNKWWITSTRNP